MRILKFTVKGQKLQKIGEYPDLIQNSKNYLQLDIQFYTKDWLNCTKTLCFTLPDGTPYNAEMQGNTYIVPEAVAACEWFNVSLLGTDINTDIRIPTNAVRIEQSESGYKPGENPPSPAPDIYEEILKECNEAKETAESVRSDADAGRFNGKDGKDGVNGVDGKDGVDGRDYVLTEADKTEIADIVLQSFVDVGEVGQ